jgi:long-chain fatty acid transport protein
MRMKKILVLAAMLAAAWPAGDAPAAGFRLPDQDAAAMGMGGAFVGQADKPSAAWYNPAAMTRLEGTQMSAGVIGIYPVMKHENVNGTTDVSEREFFAPFNLFGTAKLNERMGAGFSITSPFGLSTDWSPFSATSGVATFSRIKSLNFNPNVAFAVSDRLSLGAGIDFIKLEATLERMLSPGMLFRLDGEGSGWGANAAVLYQPTDGMNLGFSYRTRIRIDVEDAHAGVVGFPTFNNSVKTEITLPDLIDAGLSIRVSDRTTLNADINYTWWSTYDRLELESTTFIALGMGTTKAPPDEKQWKNTWAFRIGGQYRASDRWIVRAGYVYDQTPVQEAHFETRTPDSDRQGVTLGTGYSTGDITVDASYMYLLFKTRHITDSLSDGAFQVLNGTYKAQAHLLGINIVYRF